MKECREQRRYIESACDALLTTDMQGEVDKHMHPESQFVPSHAAKHRVLKKFSTKNPMQKYKNWALATQERNLPEEVSLDEEDEMKLISAHNQTTMMIITPILLETVTQVMNLMTLFHQLLNQIYPNAELCLPGKDVERIENI